MLAGAWVGLLLCIAAITMPAAFAALPSSDAGHLAGLVFAREAPVGLAAAAVLFVIVRARARKAAAAGSGSVVGVDVLLVLGALFCTVAGYYALQPLMVQARAGQGGWSFGALHAASLGFFAVKGLLVLLLAWRLSRR